MTNWDKTVISVSFGSLWSYVGSDDFWTWLIVTIWYLVAVVHCILAIIDYASKEG